jgi:hypothetical protein
MKKELRLFLFTTLLPALLGLAAAAWSLRTSWQKMQIDERRDLQARAEWFADALMSRSLSGGRILPRESLPSRQQQGEWHLEETRWGQNLSIVMSRLNVQMVGPHALTTKGNGVIPI